MRTLIFDNSCFARVDNISRTIDKNFFSQNFYERNKLFLRQLKYKDSFRDGNFKTLDDWRRDGLLLTGNMWMGLRNSILSAKRKFSNAKHQQKSMSIENFSEKLRKGSGKIRKFYEHSETKNIDLAKTTLVTSFTKLVNNVPLDQSKLTTWVSVWKFNAIPNDIKMFVFNCRNNSLPLNNRLNAYRPEVDPRCTYCRINDADSIQRDSFSHCFFYCPTVKNLLTRVFSELGINFDNDDITKQLYWFGLADNNNINVYNTVLCTNIFFDVVRYIIYKARVWYIVLNYDELLSQLHFILKNLCRASKKFKNIFYNIEMFENFSRALG
jgi:hypothetical protein